MKKRVLTALAAGLCCAVTTFGQVPSYVPTNGLVGWWPFNGNANDESGNGNNGTVNGATLTTDRFGATNKAYSFNGSDWIELNLLSAIDNSNELAVSVWVKSTGTNSNTNCSVGCAQYYFSRGYDAGNGFCINTLQGNNPYFGSSVNGGFAGGQVVADPNTTQIPHIQWHHLLMNYDGANIKLYVNGSLVGTTPYTTNIGTGNTTNAVFGRQFVPSYPYYVVGSIDDGAIWNRALTQAEITALYQGCIIPTATITPQSSTSFCQGGSVTLQATTGSGYTYQWYNNGTAIQNATQSSYQATTSGSYTVLVTNGACNITSAATVVTVNSNPTAVITPSGNTTFCQGGFVTLTASGGLAYNWNDGSTTTSIVATQTGVYTVASTSSSGCVGYASQQVTVNPSPTVSLTGLSAFTNYYGANVSLTGTPTGGSYGGQGITGNTFSPQTAGLGTAQVSYTYSNASGCSGTAYSTTIVYDTLGTVCTSYDTLYTTVTDTLIINTTLSLAPPNDQNTILIYPNPASDHITIDNGNYAAMAGYSIVIENNAGQQVFQSAIIQAQFYVDLSSWTGNGLYFVHLFDSTGNTVTVRKIVLQ